MSACLHIMSACLLSVSRIGTFSIICLPPFLKSPYSSLSLLSKNIEIRTYILANIQLLDETEQNIVIYQWRADQLFADAESRGK